MKKSKKRNVASAALACAAVLTLGIASGCGSCNDEKHNWEWDWDATGHWQYCTDDGCDETTEKEPHVDADSNGKCDVCDFTLHTHDYSAWVNTDPDQHWKECPADHEIDETTRADHDFTNGDCVCGRPNPNYVTATIHFHKPEGFGDTVYAHAYYNDGTADKNLTGDWKTYEVTKTDSDGWYSIEVRHPDGLFDDGSFNLMIVPEEGSSIDVTITASEMWVNANGNLFATKAEAVADEAAEKVEYAVYYYAPDWAEDEAVYVYTYGEDAPSVGGYNTLMSADGEDGWYKLTFETTLEFSGFSIIFHTMDEATKHEFGVTLTETLLEGKAFYFIGNDTAVFGSKEAAEAQYEENADPENQNEYTIYMYAPSAETVTASVWGNMEGAFNNGTALSSVADHDGWFTLTFSTAKIITEGGLNLNFYIDGATAAVGKYSGGAGNLHFISIGGDQGYTSFEAAEEAYEQISNAQQGTKVTVTVHVHKVEAWADLYGHGYCDLGDLTGQFGTNKGVADTENAGWYTFSIEVAESVVGDEGAGFTLMLFDITAVEGRKVIDVNVKGDCWVAYDGQTFATKTEAEDHEKNPGKPDTDPEYTETATIHFHKPEDFGDKVYAHAYYNDGTSDKNLTGEWTDNEVTETDDDGWYTIKIKHPDNLLDDNKIILMLHAGGSSAIFTKDITASEMWISAKGNLFDNEQAAKADEEAEATEYTIYVYAPDWKEEKLYIHTYNGITFTNYWTSPMEKDGDDGWYKISFETTQGISDFHYMLHNEADTIKPDIAVTVGDDFEGTDIYLIFTTAANGSIYASKEDAKAAYTNPGKPDTDPEYTETATIHFHKPEDFGDKVYAHAYYNDGTGDKNLTGDWCTTEMTDDDGDGWYTVEVKYPDGLLDGGSFTLMIVKADESTFKTLQISAARTWISAKGNLFDDEQAAKDDDHVHVSADGTWVYEEDGEENQTYHWQICEDCGEAFAREPHEYAEGSNVCTKCGYEKPEAGHDHIWSEGYYYDAEVDPDHHWQICTVDGCTEKNLLPHEHENLSHVCTVCGYNEDEGKVRIYVKVIEEYEEYYIYVWGAAGGNSVLGEFPGTKLDTDEGDGWYSVAIKLSDPSQLNGGHPIINNNDGKQYDADSNTISGLSTDVTEFFINGKTGSTTNPADFIKITIRVKVDASKVDTSKTINIYLYENGAPALLDGWPGSALEKDGDWYKVEVDVSKKQTGTYSVIINDKVGDDGSQYDLGIITANNGVWTFESTADLGDNTLLEVVMPEA